VLPAASLPEIVDRIMMLETYRLMFIVNRLLNTSTKTF